MFTSTTGKQTYVSEVCGSCSVSLSLPVSLTDANCSWTWWTGLNALKSYRPADKQTST